MRASLLLLAACGDPKAVPDATIDAAPACVATYTGNVSEVATSAQACATIVGTRLTAIAPSQLLDAPLQIAIDLGTSAIAGDYASATVGTWSASGVRTVAHSPCAFSAGSAAAPHGDFALALDAQIHGTLTLHAYVLAPEFTDCGDPTSQTVVLTF